MLVFRGVCFFLLEDFIFAGSEKINPMTQTSQFFTTGGEVKGVFYLRGLMVGKGFGYCFPGKMWPAL